MNLLHEQKMVTYIDNTPIDIPNTNITLYGIGHYGKGVKEKIHEQWKWFLL